MSKVKIVSDSCCDLTADLIEKNDIGIISMNINLDGKAYRDGIDLVPDDIYAKYKVSGVLPKTAAINPDEYTKEFKKYTDEGYDVVYMCISSGFSSNCQNAFLAAGEFDNVYVVDTKNLSTGIGYIVLEAAEMAASGLEAQVIAERLNALVPKVRVSFIIDTLEFLHKGGRCSAVAALGANLLKLKPCIEVVNGKMIVGKKYRGKLDAVLKQYINDKLADMSVIGRKRMFITHSGISEEILNMVESLVRSKGEYDELYVTRAGCTISSHCGPNTLGIIFVEE